MKKFSVVVLSYRNFEYIYDAIDSVLKQDYSDIELIISDDGSTDFPQDEIMNFVENKKKENIKSVVIRRESKNCGTVKHLNHAIDAASGEYICFLAADDALFNSRVLTKYVSGFECASEEYFIEMAQTAMYDEVMQNLECYYLQSNIQAILQDEGRKRDLFAALAWSPCLPSTSTCFKKVFFDKYGKFDESSLLIEDFPMHFRLALENIPIYYNNFCAIKHRAGGISHGATGALSETKIRYWKECLNTRETVLRNIELLDKEEQKNVIRKYRREKIFYDSQIWGRSPRWKDRMRYRLMHPIYLFNRSIMDIDSKISNLGVYVVIAAYIGVCFLPDILGLFNILFHNIEMDMLISIGSKCCMGIMVLGVIMSIIHFWAMLMKCEKNAPEYCMYLLA